MKEYTVVEVAAILVSKGIIRRNNRVNKNKNGQSKISTGEQQVRLWIREYNKIFQNEYNRYITEGDSHEKASEYAHTIASNYGIKAAIRSKKEGYRITKDDLKEFIDVKLGSSLETKLIEGLKKEAITRASNVKVVSGKLQSEWFLQGFQEAIEFLKANLDVAISKEVINLPSYDWFIDEKKTFATNYRIRETNSSTILWVEFINQHVNNIQFKMRIYRQNDTNKIKTNVEWSIKNAILAGHNRAELDNIVSIETNIATLKEFFIEQIPESDENKLLILMMLTA
ncbi:hypothetical protein J7E38_00080 [Bacillus sp. ISL-35]|uniref:hypothetical protein n=1 Tax=Bacillus sp. ISL-35 TaxID=2819122 RepID=UPI001BED0E33|nr:hypothetical protein [Bacillus sp. ISL-35]MBT2677372.1 hypothetical protein [Bacillus sp. ISL-35]MBT2702241.1 hypothetical protein [Chryseobacterium sp. ISL-80]